MKADGEVRCVGDRVKYFFDQIIVENFLRWKKFDDLTLGASEVFMFVTFFLRTFRTRKSHEPEDLIQTFPLGSFLVCLLDNFNLH